MKRRILLLVFMPVLSLAMQTPLDPNTEKLHNIIQYSNDGGSDESAREVARLLAAGADAKALNFVTAAHYWTPLHVAARRGFPKIVKLLLPYYKDDLNPRDNNGGTPLLDAINLEPSQNLEEIVTILLNAGADPEIKGGSFTPIQFAEFKARESGGPEIDKKIVKILKDYSSISPESILNPTPETLEKAIKVGATSLVQQLLTQLKPTPEILDKVIKGGLVDSVKQLLPQVLLSLDQLRFFNQLARARFDETNDPVYKAIRDLLYEQVKKIHALMGTTPEGSRSPMEIAATIIGTPTSQPK